MRAGRRFRQHGPQAPARGNQRRSTLWESGPGLRHLAMHLATEDERNRPASRMTFPIHVQAGEVLRIEARLNKPADECLVGGVDCQPRK
jgi:hypothetical protein